MSALLARPVGLGAWAFNVFDGAEKVARVAPPGVAGAGTIDLFGAEFAVERVALLRRGTRLTFAGLTVGESESESVLGRRFRLTLGPEVSGADGPREVILRVPATFRTFAVEMVGEPPGRIRRTSWLGRDARIEVSDALPLAARLFAFAVVADEWRRRARSG